MSKYSSTISLLQSENAGTYYFLGAMISDGSLYKEKINTCKIMISSKDKDWLTDINSILLDNEGFPRTRKDNKQHELWLYNSNVYDWLVGHECIENKSLIVKMPNVPDKFLPDFMRGCIDGDGSISSCHYNKTKGSKTYQYVANVIYLCSGSKKFLEALNTRLINAGIKGSFCEVKKEVATLKNGRIIIPRNPHYRLTFSGKTAYNLLKFTHYPNNIISMFRKRVVADKILSHYED